MNGHNGVFCCKERLDLVMGLDVSLDHGIYTLVLQRMCLCCVCTALEGIFTSEVTKRKSNTDHNNDDEM